MAWSAFFVAYLTEVWYSKLKLGVYDILEDRLCLFLRNMIPTKKNIY